MSDTKMLQLILDKVTKIEKDVADLRKRIDQVEKNLVARLDKQGSQLAILDDLPAIAML